jgi:hypothetical protein
MPRLYRCENHKTPPKNPPCKCPPPPPPKPKPPPKKPSPPKKKKLNFKTCKKNTINSLNEVEHFLNDFHGFWDYIRLYKNVSNIFNRKRKN